ncbi:MAG TPA: patatin-like phospholipase family protein [Stellaceae bacterium]|nr:patatin-like phospholipase family protein [Stellaceae bacterium]
MGDRKAPARPASYDKKVALVLQGGGALGSYQAGVYEALSTSQYLPDWVAGISIGAINAAIIAGNPLEKRVERLRAFWEGVTAPSSLWPVLSSVITGDRCRTSSLNALMFGQPGFFAPRPVMQWLLGVTPTSYYDTSGLKDTLERLVDFDRINAREIHFSVGAVNVRTGNFVYFDNAHTTIRPEHIMASGALPPGFPAVEIDGECYWDGGLVSNTPLQYVLEYIPRRSRLTFQVDLFPARGRQPTDLEEVGEREKDIRYSSRTRVITDLFRTMHDVRHNINSLWDQLSENLRNTPEAKFLYNFGCVTTMDVVELIYRPTEPQGYFKDYEFSRNTMRIRWAQGLSDAQTTLLAAPWLTPMPPEVGARTFDVLEDLRRNRASGQV